MSNSTTTAGRYRREDIPCPEGVHSGAQRHVTGGRTLTKIASVHLGVEVEAPGGRSKHLCWNDSLRRNWYIMT